MDTLLREWLNRLERRQDAHDEVDRKTFLEIFNRLLAVETKMAKLLVIVGIINAIGGALLTVVGLLIAKRMGF